ncbi:MAG: TonB-dependent receptor [Candidatus Riflebacteria bacterium]|nr:TonB-dependent receptor [Candidatus Riflebacteria bacterium]
MKSRYVFILLSLTLLLPCISSAADTSYAGVFKLDEIVIEDTRPELESSSRVRVITDEELDQRGVRTLDEALELLPGINVRVGNGGAPRLDIRGYRARHVALLLDGIPLNSTYDGQMDPRLIPVEIIKKIKVSYGTSSAIYGSGALGGVINIITKSGAEETDKLFLQTETGTRIQQYGLLRASGKEGDFDYFLGLSNELRNGYELSNNFTPTSTEDGGRRENSDARRSSLLLKVNLTPSERWKYGVTVGQQQAEFGLPHSTINDNTDLFASRAKYERVDYARTDMIQLSAAYDAPGPWEFKLWHYYNHMEEETNGYDDATYSGMTDYTVKGTFHQNSKTRISGQSLQAIRSIGEDSSLVFSLKTDRSDWDSYGQIRDRIVGDGNYGIRAFINDRYLKNQAIAMEYNLAASDKIDINLGGSLNSQKRQDRDDQQGNEFNIGVSREFGEKTSAHIAAARKIRFPAIQQLYDAVSGSPDLDLEKAMNYEAGLTHDFNKETSGSLTVFHSTVENYIEKNDDIVPVYENFQKYLFKGVELSAKHQCKRPLLLRTALTLMKSEEVDSTVGRDELQYRPKTKFSLSGTYNAKNGLETYCEFLYIGGQNFYTKKAPYQKASLNEINLTNIRFSKPVRYDSLHVYLGVDNLFDRNYETSYGVPAPGRFWYLGLQAKL